MVRLENLSTREMDGTEEMEKRDQTPGKSGNVLGQGIRDRGSRMMMKDT